MVREGDMDQYGLEEGEALSLQPRRTAMDPADDDEMLLGYVGDRCDAPPLGDYNQGEAVDDSESRIWQS